jgi:DegV family protein with EDD domain
LQTHIVTDSSAHFAHPQLTSQYPVTVVPNVLHIAGEDYREGVDLTAEQALELIAHQITPPTITPPSVDDYVAVYTHLAHFNDAIVSIHTSRDISDSWKNARAAAQQLEDHVKIAVIDSRTIDAAQGMVVRAATRIIEETDDMDDIIKAVRGATERVYCIYYVESLDYLMRNNLMAPSHALLSAVHKTMPLITVEDGLILAMEKIRTRSQAIDRLVDFAIEFVDLEDALILHHRMHMSEQTRALSDRLSSEFPSKHFPHTVYSPSLAALIGADATGLVILEEAWDDDDMDKTD